MLPYVALRCIKLQIPSMSKHSRIGFGNLKCSVHKSSLLSTTVFHSTDARCESPAWEGKGSPEGTRRESEAYLLPAAIHCCSTSLNICCSSVDPDPAMEATHVAFVPATSVGHKRKSTLTHVSCGTQYVGHMCHGSHHCVGHTTPGTYYKNENVFLPQYEMYNVHCTYWS